jgi:hypothetical protein
VAYKATAPTKMRNAFRLAREIALPRRARAAIQSPAGTGIMEEEQTPPDDQDTNMETAVLDKPPVSGRKMTSQMQRAEAPQMQEGAKQDVFTLDEGSVVLQWPSSMSAESYEDFEGWLQLVLRKVKRSIVTSKTEQEEAD